MTPEQISGTYDAGIVVRRWAATWLDLLVLGGLLGAALAVGERLRGPLVGVWLVLFVLYYPLLEGLTGKTPGKLLCGLKVVDAQGRTPGILKAIVRTLIRFFEINPLLMGGLPAGIAVLASKKRQRLGDAAAGTFVLKTEDLAYLQSPPAAPLGEFNLPGIAAPAAGYPYPPYVPSAYPGRNTPLPSRNPLWALPGAVLMTLAAAGLLTGGIAANQASEKVQPVTVACGQFLAAPGEGWYRLTGCHFALEDAVYEFTASDTEESDSEDSGDQPSPGGTRKIDVIYIPVFGTPNNEGEKTPLLMRTRDEHIAKLLGEWHSLADHPGAKRDAWILTHLKDLNVHRDLMGTVERDPYLTESVRTVIDGLRKTRLASGFVLLKEGEKPIADGAIAAIVAGVVVAFLAFAFWVLLLIGCASGAAPRRAPAG